MTEKELNKLVNLLKDRQPVMVSGLWVRAIRLHGGLTGSECKYCEMDCLCKGDIADTCVAINLHAKDPYYLSLCYLKPDLKSQ